MVVRHVMVLRMMLVLVLVLVVGVFRAAGAPAAAGASGGAGGGVGTSDRRGAGLPWFLVAVIALFVCYWNASALAFRRDLSDATSAATTACVPSPRGSLVEQDSMVRTPNDHGLEAPAISECSSQHSEQPASPSSPISPLALDRRASWPTEAQGNDAGGCADDSGDDDSVVSVDAPMDHADDADDDSVATASPPSPASPASPATPLRGPSWSAAALERAVAAAAELDDEGDAAAGWNSERFS
eukprot:gene12449-18623_t